MKPTKYQVWFDYLGLRLSIVVTCFPGEQEDRARAGLAAKHDIPGDRLRFIKAVEVRG